MALHARPSLAITLACALVFMLGLPAFASAPLGSAATSLDSTPRPTLPATAAERDVMSWVGTVVFTHTRSDTGETSESARWSDVVLKYVCGDTHCDLSASGGVSTAVAFGAKDTLFGLRDFTDLALDDAGMFSRSFPAVGDPCIPSEQVLPISLAEGTLTTNSAVMTLATEEWSADCADGTRNVFSASLRTFEGVYLSGDPCALTGTCEPLVAAVLPSVPAIVPVEEIATIQQGKAPIAPQGSASQLASGAAAAPSVFSALTPIQDSKMGLLDICVAVVVTVILSLLVALPKRLFSAAIGAVPKRWIEYKRWLAARTSRMGKWWHSVLARVAGSSVPAVADSEAGPPCEPHDRFGSGPWRRAAIGVVAAGVISAFVDPGFGFNLGSLRVALSLSVSFLLTVVVGWSVAIWIARRFTAHVSASYQFKPLSLVVVAVAVLFTRLTGMEPGMVFGLVAGVVLGTMASKAAEARLAVAQTGYAFAMGLVGWLAYSALAPSLAGVHNVFAALLIDTLAGLSVAGFAAAPIALLPVAGMGGTKIYAWNRKVWFAMYSVGLIGFFWVLLPMSYSWKEVSLSLKAWVALYVAYAGVALVAYFALVRPWEHRTAITGNTPDSDADSDDFDADDLDVDDFADGAIGDGATADPGGTSEKEPTPPM